MAQARSLRSNTALQDLRLGGNNIRDCGLQKLARTLRYAPRPPVTLYGGYDSDLRVPWAHPGPHRYTFLKLVSHANCPATAPWMTDW